MKQLAQHSLIVGFALFSMFFGAGNTIFPPWVGLVAGPEWFTGFICYYMADVGLALVAVYAMLRTRSIDKVETIMVRLGKTPAKVMMAVILICIGPLLAMPRTCATTFSMSVAPLVGADSLTASLLFTALFFGLTLAFSIKESSLVDLVGRYLTPVLILALLSMIGLGIASPMGPISASSFAADTANVAWTGVSAGYQTLDVLAVIAFGMLVVNAMKARGYAEPRMQFISVALASLVAGAALFIVYGGLCYVGATASGLYPPDMDKGQLVANIAARIFGPAGAALLTVIIGLACLTTAIALAGSMGTFFNLLTKGRLPYKRGVVISCLMSAVIANFGLESIINLAAPILTVVYPGVLAVIVLSLFDRQIAKDNVFRFAAAGAMAVSFCEVMGWYWPGAFAFITHLPLQAYGFGWLGPSALCALAGALVPGARGSQGRDSGAGRGSN